MPKITSLPKAASITVDDIVPIVHNGDNYGVTMDVMKDFFRDSTLALFDAIDDSDQNINEGSAGVEDGASYAIVFLTKRGVFAHKRVMSGTSDTYFADFPRKNDFMIGGAVRTDRAYFCMSDKEIYYYGNTLVSIFDTVRINAMTEDEFANLQNPIEGAFYATYE